LGPLDYRIWNGGETFTVTWNLRRNLKPPSIPTLLSPSDHATVSPTPTFWLSSTTQYLTAPHCDPTKFVMEVMRMDDNTIRTFETDFVDRTLGTAQASYTVPSNQPLPPGIYLWRAKAVDKQGLESAWSDIRAFGVDECALSGADLMRRFPESKSLDDPNLDPTFAYNVKRFVAALAAARDAKGRPRPAHVQINETYRSPARAYLAHYAFRVAREGLDPRTVPSPFAVSPPVAELGDVCWVHTDSNGHYDVQASRRAAEEMLKVFAPPKRAGGAPNVAHRPSYPSNHQNGTAVDMTITWKGSLVVTDSNGQPFKITGTPRTGNNPRLHSVGATYGVKKLLGDLPHWSSDGH
jgi:hypothetical protein